MKSSIASLPGRRCGPNFTNKVAHGPSSSSSGGKGEQVKRNGKTYKVRTGARGGKYILLTDDNGKKNKSYVGA